MGLARSQLDNVGRRCGCGKRLQFAPSIYDWWGQWFWRQMILRWLWLRVTALLTDAVQLLDDHELDFRRCVGCSRGTHFRQRSVDLQHVIDVDDPASRDLRLNLTVCGLQCCQADDAGISDLQPKFLCSCTPRLVQPLGTGCPLFFHKPSSASSGTRSSRNAKAPQRTKLWPKRPVLPLFVAAHSTLLL
jgi:hypothetical protein